MPEIQPQDPSLKKMTGLHLWHAPMSSCSQRVRIALAEANKQFVSHLINLERGQHATPQYQKIHPKGVVPALVDNGRLFIESIDIIQHIAKDDAVLNNTISSNILRMADEAQVDLKLLTFEFLFRGAATKSDEQATAFQNNHKNEWLKQFYQDFAAGFGHERIRKSVVHTQQGFQALDNILADGRPFLSGQHFTLNDIAWMPNIHRFNLMGWPLSNTSHLQKWFLRVAQRPSYQHALVAWENEQSNTLFAEYTQKRRAEGTDIQAFGNFSN